MTEDVELREQDKWLPIANVYRIMKNALPRNAKVSKDAKECVQECVSEFVSFITSEASEKCSAEKRKTVNGEDVLFAMASLGFENYAEVLKIYLTKYREYQNSRDRAKRAASGSNGGLLEDEDVKDESNPANLSNLSDISTLSTLASQPHNASHMNSGDIDLLQSSTSGIQKSHDGSQLPLDMSRQNSRDNIDPNTGDSDGDTPGNIVDYAEEPIYEDFQID